MKMKRKRERENEKEIYYKKLTHVIMEADKSQDLQSGSASRRPRRAAARVPVCIVGYQTWDPEDPVFQFDSKAGKKPMC